MIAVILSALVGVCVSGDATTIVTRSKINVGFNKAYAENILFESPVRSNLHCAVLCNQHECCGTFTFDQKICRGHAMVVTSHTSSLSTPGARSYSRKNAANKPKSCVEAQLHSNCSASGVVTIYPEDDNTPLEVFCDQDTDGGGWLVFQHRQDASVDFYRNWTSYQNFFGDLTGNFWLGLDALHMLTSRQQYELRVDLMMWNGTKGYATYNNFSISDSSDNYRLNYDSFTRGNAGDSLYYHRGRQFTTWDRDHDTWSGTNSAQYFHSAWWYSSNSHTSLNGEYMPNSTAQPGKGIYWYHFGIFDSHKFSEMKIRVV
ncbi:microfibril-associated glycoprotein 4-like [Littorina saxatilis]|uniref:microfibril-associated glycoprotein 4-like n=1 Tax=Littorina saxatilis TaxID=31220 RepID=UPI0038B59020